MKIWSDLGTLNLSSQEYTNPPPPPPEYVETNRCITRIPSRLTYVTKAIFLIGATQFYTLRKMPRC